MAIRFEDYSPAVVKRLKAHIKNNLNIASFFVVGRAKRNIDKTFGNPTGSLGEIFGYTPHRTGHLRGSMRHEIVETSSAMIGRIGTNNVYSRIHELGGIIRPKSKRALAIPLTNEAKKAGSPSRMGGKLFYTPAAQQKRDPWTVGYLWPHRGGSLFGYQTPLFVLRTRVHMPARPYLRPALKDNMKHVERIMSRPMKSTGRAK